VDVRQHPGRCRLAVGTGNGRDLDSTGATGRKQHVHHGTGDVVWLWLAFTRRYVHAESRRRIDLADAAAVFLVGLADIVGDEIHTAHVESDGGNGPDRHGDVVGVHYIGHVDGGPARG